MDGAVKWCQISLFSTMYAKGKKEKGVASHMINNGMMYLDGA